MEETFTSRTKDIESGSSTPTRSSAKFIFALDLLGITSSLFIISLMRLESSNAFDGSRWYVLGLIFLTLFSLELVEGYDLLQLTLPSIIKRTVLAGLISISVTALVTFIFRLEVSGVLGRGVLFGTISVFTLYATLIRVLTYKLIFSRAKNIRWLLITNQNHFSQLKIELDQNKSLGQIEYIDPKEFENAKFQETIQKNWSGIILSPSVKLSDSIVRTILNKRISGTRVFNLSNFFEIYCKKIPLSDLQDSHLALSPGFNLQHNALERQLKGFLDYILAFLILILSLPLLVLTSLLLVITQGFPIFFKQERVGLNGKLFWIYKFRTMIRNAEKDGAQFAAKGDMRITHLGKLLRVSRIDEIPQVLNIIKGEMSFIGPRPERPEFVQTYQQEIPYYDLRHTVKPGLTGWAQVNYGYGASDEDTVEKLQYDLYYIKNYSLLLDLQILLKTMSTVLFQKGT